MFNTSRVTTLRCRSVLLGIFLALASSFAIAQAPGEFTCAKEGKVQVCKRSVPDPNSASARAQCKFKCTTRCPHGQCVEVCKGNGPQCDGKDPHGVR
jgi:hypothetical protein